MEKFPCYIAIDYAIKYFARLLAFEITSQTVTNESRDTVFVSEIGKREFHRATSEQ